MSGEVFSDFAEDFKRLGMRSAFRNSKRNGNLGTSRSNGIGQFYSMWAATFSLGGLSAPCSFASGRAAGPNALLHGMAKTRGQL